MKLAKRHQDQIGWSQLSRLVAIQSRSYVDIVVLSARCVVDFAGSRIRRLACAGGVVAVGEHIPERRACRFACLHALCNGPELLLEPPQLESFHRAVRAGDRGT
jgi:hypothetical protein